jgi:hypothetical protein
VSLLLDAGALIAVERDDRDTLALIKDEWRRGRVPLTHGGVVGQVWRTGAERQARLLPGVEVAALDAALGRRAGRLLGAAKRHDVIDAALVVLGKDGDEIITSDPDDLQPLAASAGIHVELVPA